MRDVLEHILNDDNAPGTAEGKAVNLMMKFGAQWTGELRRFPDHDNLYVVKTFGRDQEGRPVMMDVYFDVNDVACVLAPASQTKVVGATVMDLDKFRVR